MCPRKCPACESTQFTTLEAIPNPTCSECGLLISDNVEAPPPLDAQDDNDDATLQWADFYTVTNETEKQTAQGLDDLFYISNQLQLSTDAILTAAEIFADAAVHRLAKGRSWRLIAAAAVCAGARTSSEPCPTGSIADTAGIERNRLRHALRLFQRELDQNIVNTAPKGHVPYICDTLGLSSDITESSERLLDSYKEFYPVSGKDPVGIAGATVYEAADGQVTQREIADEAGITQETIRVRLRELRNITDKQQ